MVLWCEGTSSAVGRKREKGGGEGGVNMGAGGEAKIWLKSMWASRMRQKWDKGRGIVRGRGRKKTIWESCLATVLKLSRHWKSRNLKV